MNRLTEVICGKSKRLMNSQDTLIQRWETASKSTSFI